MLTANLLDGYVEVRAIRLLNSVNETGELPTLGKHAVKPGIFVHCYDGAVYDALD